MRNLFLRGSQRCHERALPPAPDAPSAGCGRLRAPRGTGQGRRCTRCRQRRAAGNRPHRAGPAANHQPVGGRAGAVRGPAAAACSADGGGRGPGGGPAGPAGRCGQGRADHRATRPGRGPGQPGREALRRRGPAGHPAAAGVAAAARGAERRQAGHRAGPVDGGQVALGGRASPPLAPAERGSGIGHVRGRGGLAAGRAAVEDGPAPVRNADAAAPAAGRRRGQVADRRGRRGRGHCRGPTPAACHPLAHRRRSGQLAAVSSARRSPWAA